MMVLGTMVVVNVGEQGSGNFWLPVDLLVTLVVGIILEYSPENVL